jgi:dephospho-CoA kinase
VGSGDRAHADLCTVLVVVTAPDDVRLARGLARDGEMVREEWLAWMAAEREHLAAERTAERADLAVDGAV